MKMKMKMRSINTAFWSDPWVMDLDPIEKLLFLYLITNDKTNLAGIYELHPRRMAFETGIDREMIEKILKRFQENDKVIFNTGWILICNFTKNQRLSPQMATNIQGILNELPDKIKTDTLYIPYIEKYNTLCRSIKKEEVSIKKEEVSIKDEGEKKKIPTWEEVKEYSLQNKKNVDLGALEFKYKSWIENNWWTSGKDSHPIKNWKTTLLNTLSHLPENKTVKTEQFADENDKSIHES